MMLIDAGVPVKEGVFTVERDQFAHYERQKRAARTTLEQYQRDCKTRERELLREMGAAKRQSKILAVYGKAAQFAAEREAAEQAMRVG